MSVPALIPCAARGWVYPALARPDSRRVEATTDAALQWLALNEGGPVFLWVHYFDAHQPYRRPENIVQLKGLSFIEADVLEPGVGYSSVAGRPLRCEPAVKVRRESTGRSAPRHLVFQHR